MTKRVLHALRLDKIAAVDMPCQEHAVAAIIKTKVEAYDALLKGKYSDSDRKDMAGKEAMADGSYPVKDAEDLGKAIDAVGRGRNNSHAAIRRHVMSRAKALGLESKIPDTWNDGGKVGKAICEAIRKAGIQLADPDGDAGAEDFDAVLGQQKLKQQFWDGFYAGTSALQQSLTTIVGDDAADKPAMVQQSLKEFADYIAGILPGEVGKALATGIVAKFAGGAGITVQGDVEMDALKKALGLPATATEAEVMAKLKERDDALAKAKADAAFGALTDVEKVYAGKLPEAERTAFVAKSKEDRAKEVKDKTEDPEDACAKELARGDAFKTAEGVLVRKGMFNAPEAYALAKSQNETIIKQAAAIAKAEDEKIAKEFEGIAEEHGFAKSFAPTLRKALGTDETARTALLKEIKAMRAQAETGGVFKEFGGNGGGTGAGNAESELVAKANELRKADPKLSEQQAYARVYKDVGNREIVKRMKAEAGGTA